MKMLHVTIQTDLLGLPVDFEPLLGLAIGHIEKPLEERQIPENRIGITRINDGGTV